MAAAARQFVDGAHRSVASQGRFRVALSGGSTAQLLHHHLAGSPYREQIPWSRLQLFWGDERCVPPGHAESNYGAALRNLIVPAGLHHGQIHRMAGERAPVQAAADYEREIRASFGLLPATPSPSLARFDLIVLGMGEDGHTASLFPRSTLLRETQRWVGAAYVPKVGMWRISLLPALINQAARVIFVVGGAEKAAALRRVSAGPYCPTELPAQLIAPVAGRVLWLVDRAAAQQL